MEKNTDQGLGAECGRSASYPYRNKEPGRCGAFIFQKTEKENEKKYEAGRAGDLRGSLLRQMTDFATLGMVDMHGFMRRCAGKGSQRRNDQQNLPKSGIKKHVLYYHKRPGNEAGEAFRQTASAFHALFWRQDRGVFLRAFRSRGRGDRHGRSRFFPSPQDPRWPTPPTRGDRTP